MPLGEGKFMPLGEGKLRAERAKNYLVDEYRIDGDRIIAFDGGYKKNLTVVGGFETR